ncbi:MAG TPA: FUSC family protein [Solirubrobacteraceae bacterium]|nr:FUSC family protein [Solirubrobacteraceae bacterium]
MRAAVVIPATFAIAFEVIGNAQMGLFTSFGGVATLVMASFGGTRRERLIAHASLAAIGTLLVTVGTAVSSSVPLAAAVTLVTTFLVVFAGVIGPRIAAGATAALVAYLLSAASSAAIGTVPDRLAGWWLASIAGTAAVLLFSADVPGERLRAAAANVAEVIADELDAMLSGTATRVQRASSQCANDELRALFTASPFRPTALASRDQGVANAIELLDWCTAQLDDMVREHADLRDAAQTDRDLVAAAAAVLRASGRLLRARDAEPDLERLEQLRLQSCARLQVLARDRPDFERQARTGFHAYSLAVSARAIGADALVAQRVVDSEWLAAARTRWFIGGSTRVPDAERVILRVSRVASRHASIRSVWLVNSVRAAIALAAAVAVADLSSVQHGFWVVLGALSVLRTNATSTGSTALRAFAGTVLGFVLGAALVLAIGGSSTALWIAFPIALFVTAYVPGTAPFAVGQAAFTIFLVVLFNLVAPSGWQVGVVRIEDIAIGCGVSLVVGGLFWPRGVAAIVGDDLADAYRAGARYLREAIDRVCVLPEPHSSAVEATVTAGIRVDHALRAFLTEQGTKHITSAELWRLVGGAQRLRLTANAVAQLPRDGNADPGARAALSQQATSIEGWYEQLAALLERPRGTAPATPTVPTFHEPGATAPRSRDLVWLRESLDHLGEHLAELVAPAQQVAVFRRRPWWR